MNSNSAISASRKRARQRGAVMIVSLIMLVVITLLAVSAIQTSNLEVLMASNSQARASALAKAENALVDGELVIRAMPDPTPETNWSEDVKADGTLEAVHDGLYIVDDGIASTVDDIDWTLPDPIIDPPPVPVGYQLSPSRNQFTLEYMGGFDALGSSGKIGKGVAADKRFLYRITGRGEFGRGGTRFVQSIFATME